MENKYLEDVPDKTHIFVDSNILIYHLHQDKLYGQSCKSFLKRIEDKKIIAYSAPHIITETLFIYLRLWIILNKKVSPKKVLKYLKKNPEVINDVDFRKPELLFKLNKILSVNEAIVKELYTLRNTNNLLPNDALSLSVMKHNKLSDIATCDNDFDNIEGFDVYIPEKI